MRVTPQVNTAIAGVSTDSRENLQIQIPPVWCVKTVPTSMGLQDLVTITGETIIKRVSQDQMLWVAEQFQDMFKKLAQVPRTLPPPRAKDNDIQALVEQARQRDLPPPPGLPHPLPGNPDHQNVVLQVVMKAIWEEYSPGMAEVRVPFHQWWVML